MIKKDIHRFDTSDFPVDNIYNIPLVNRKKIGLMKDEMCGRIVIEFIGLRSKLYCLRVLGEILIKKIKGVKKENIIVFDDFKKCLINKKLSYTEQFNIVSKFHNVFTQKQVKLALSPYDDKRIIMENSTDTLPWGYYKTIIDNQVV